MKEFEFILMDGTVETKLTHAPAGWEDIQVTYTRHSVYFGLFRTFGVALKFVLDGAEYLREKYYTFGMERIIGIRINRLDKITLKYNLFYEGEIDFSTWSDQGEYVEVSIVDGGLNRLLKANEKTVYSIRIDGTNQHDKNVIYDHVALVNSIKHQGRLTKYVPDMDVTYNIPISFEQKEVVKDIVSTGDQTTDTSTWFIMPDKDLQFIYRVRLGLYVRLSLPGETVGFSIDIVGGNVVNVYSNSGVGTLNDLGYINVELTDSINAFQEVKLQVHIYSRRPGVTGVFEITAVEVDTYFITRDVTTLNFPALSPMRLFSELVERIAPGYPVKSDFLESLSWLAFTSGLALRNISPVILKTSFADFFAAIDSLFDVGLGIEIIDNLPTLVIERKDYFLAEDGMLETSMVSDFKVINASELQYNTIKIGYEDNAAGDGIGMNGLYEFNSGQEYTLNVTKVVKTLDKVCKYRADIFGIEMIVMTGRAENKAMDSDNQVFMFHINENGTLYRNYSVVNGFFNSEQAATVYNLFLSPKRSLKRQGGSILSFLKTPVEAKYVSGDRNTNVESKLNYETETVVESADEYFEGSSGLFLPIIVEAEAVIDGDLHTSIMQSHRKCIKINSFEGMISEVTNSTSNDNKSEIKLILKRNSDLTPLIK